jgi:hypothetical protein
MAFTSESIMYDIKTSIFSAGCVGTQILALRRLSQEDHEFKTAWTTEQYGNLKVSLSYVAEPCLQKNQKKKKTLISATFSRANID